MENQIKEQVEYYLSDKNLTNDQFFRNLIEKSENGYFDLDFILNCKKMSEFEGINKELIVKCLNDSKEVEISEDKNKIRRIGNKSLPNSKKKVVLSLKDLDQQEHENLLEIDIIKFFIDKFLKKTDKELESIFSKVLGFDILFVSYIKKEGFILFLSENKIQENINKLIEDGLEIKKCKITFNLCDQDDRIEFKKIMSKNIKKIHMILKKKCNFSIIDTDKEIKKTDYKEDKIFTFMNKKYFGNKQLKNMFKDIINNTINGDKITNENDILKLKELIKYHSNPEKFDDIDYFTVNNHYDYPQTRCFYVINNKGEKIDFSFHKCLNNINN